MLISCTNTDCKLTNSDFCKAYNNVLHSARTKFTQIKTKLINSVTFISISVLNKVFQLTSFTEIRRIANTNKEIPVSQIYAVETVRFARS